MLVLLTAEAIRHAIARYSDHLPVPALERYATLIETEPIAWIFIIQPGDTAGALEAVRGRPFGDFEFVDQHNQWFEACMILSDDGFGHVVLLRDQPDSDSELLKTCRTFATIAE